MKILRTDQKSGFLSFGNLLVNSLGESLVVKVFKNFIGFFSFVPIKNSRKLFTRLKYSYKILF